MSPIVTTNSSPAGRIKRVKAASPLVTHLSVDFEDGTIGALSQNLTAGAAITVETSGGVSGGKFARCKCPTTAKTTGEAYLQFAVPNTAILDGTVYQTWYVRVPSSTRSTIIAAGTGQIKLTLCRSTSPATNFHVIGIGNTFDDNSTLISTFNDDGNVRFSPTMRGTLLNDTWTKITAAIRRESGVGGYVRTWIDDVEVTTEGFGSGMGNDDRAKNFTFRFGIAYTAFDAEDVVTSDITVDVDQCSITNYYV